MAKLCVAKAGLSYIALYWVQVFILHAHKPLTFFLKVFFIDLSSTVSLQGHVRLALTGGQTRCPSILEIKTRTVVSADVADCTRLHNTHCTSFRSRRKLTCRLLCSHHASPSTGCSITSKINHTTAGRFFWHMLLSLRWRSSCFCLSISPSTSPSLSYSSWVDRLSGQGLALVPGMGSETCVKMASRNQLEDVYEAHQEILGFCRQMMKASNHYSSAASVVQSGWKCIEQRCLCHLATFYLFFVYFMFFFLFSFSFFLHSLHFFFSLFHAIKTLMTNMKTFYWQTCPQSVGCYRPLSLSLSLVLFNDQARDTLLQRWFMMPFDPDALLE